MLRLPGSIRKLGTAAFRAVGNAAGQLVAMDATAKLPAIDGSQLTNLPSGSFHGQCQLTKSGSNLIILPKDGNKLIINSAQQTIPDAGVTLAAPATTTWYYIYAYMNSGTMTLEASTTTHATQAGTGVEIKSGDATRTLVGQARTLSSAWVDSATQRFVRSWFNRKGLDLKSNYTVDRSTSSAPFVITSTNDRIEYLNWTDEVFHFALTASVSNVLGDINYLAVYIDGGSAASVYTSDYNYSQETLVGRSVTAEGYHYVDLYFGTNADTMVITTGGYTNLMGWFG